MAFDPWKSCFNLQAYLILLLFILLCFIDIAFFFYKLKVRPSTSKKILTWWRLRLWLSFLEIKYLFNQDTYFFFLDMLLLHT